MNRGAAGRERGGVRVGDELRSCASSSGRGIVVVGRGPRSASPSARDLAYTLHPYTNARAHEQKGPSIIERGQGVYVCDDQGNEYIEALAGLWSVAIGFGEERLARVAAEQMRKLPYYHCFAHKAHHPGIDLAEKLVQLTPDRLSRVLFTNSGSEANDTVIKLIWCYNNAVGLPRKKKIISRLRAYHGITIASGSLTGLSLNHRDFDLPISNILHTACPHYEERFWLSVAPMNGPGAGAGGAVARVSQKRVGLNRRQEACASSYGV
jgi:adenosylmethionine-8-amino-7-oxononanoate aminotransferase